MILGMRAITTLLSFSCALALSSDLNNANHIFNSIQSAGKLWGSCVNHNGMTFYLATVPKGTRLFHGDASTEPRTDVVFLAFEPEHALMFARPKGPRGPHGPGSNHFEHESSDRLKEPSGAFLRFWDKLTNLLRPKRTGDGEVPLDPSPEYGWLHTYVTNRDLRLVYVDGLSAAKSNRGTLDSQDLILLNGTIDEDRNGHNSDYDRLYALCDLAESDFLGKIDGMLRLEMAFEVNLCNPLEKLDLVTLEAVSRAHEGGHGPESGGFADEIPVYSSRYHGIGGDRVRINFDDFLTVYNFDLDLFPNDTLLPRLDHLSMSELEPIQSAVKPWILAYDSEQGTVDWQAVADMLVTRFGQSLKTISKSNSMDFILKEVHRLLNPFVDFLDQRPEQLLDRCSSQFIPSNSSTLAADAIYTVSHRICTDLAALIDTDTSEEARERILTLVDYLQWAYFKECEGCKGDEFCQIPIWPLGSQKDYDNPQCQKFSKAFANGNDYWKAW